MTKTLYLLQDTLTRRNDNVIQVNNLSDCLASVDLSKDSVSQSRNSVFPLVFADVADELAMRYSPEVFYSNKEF